jgi:hypothetical protein
MRDTKVFEERTKVKTSNETVRKYFLVYEGDETEVQYFEGVNSNKLALGINPLIELRPLLRSYNERGWSNPKKILDVLIGYLDESKIGSLSVSALSNRVVDYLIEEGSIAGSIYSPNDIYRILITSFKNDMNLMETDVVGDIESASKNVSSCLFKNANIENVIEDIVAYLLKQNITYSEGFDKVCLIVDRDKYSFVANPGNDQYEYVLQKCKEKGYDFYLSNPCFEFWLLLHFDEVFTLDKELLFNNHKVNNSRNYAEDELRKLLPGYKKSNVKFELLKSRIEIAIKNEKNFCEDISELKVNIGCNIGLLIDQLKEV